jgi:hypothetical protein
LFILDSFEKKITRIYRIQLAVLRLKIKYGPKRLKKAAARANYYNKQNAADFSWLLKNGLDNFPMAHHTDFLGRKRYNFG